MKLDLTPPQPYETMTLEELSARHRELRDLESQVREEMDKLEKVHTMACAVTKAANTLDKTLGNETEEEAALAVLLRRREERRKRRESEEGKTTE